MQTPLVRHRNWLLPQVGVPAKRQKSIVSLILIFALFTWTVLFITSVMTIIIYRGTTKVVAFFGADQIDLPPSH